MSSTSEQIQNRQGKDRPKKDQQRKERIDRGIKVRSDGLYALMSFREMSYLTLPRFILIAGFLLLPFFVPGMYWQRVISIVCIYSLLALSFDFLGMDMSGRM